MKIIMNNYTFLIMVISALFSAPSFSCSCSYAGNFVEYTLGKKGVVKATIKEFGQKLPHGKTLYESMTVEITEIIKGNYKGKQLTLLGDPGDLCRDYVDSRRFKIGSQHLILLSNENSSQPLDGCGESSVVIRNGKVEGVEWKDKKKIKYTIELNTFIKKITDQ